MKLTIKSCTKCTNNLLNKFEKQKLPIKCALIAIACIAMVLTITFAPPASLGFGAVLINLVRIPFIMAYIATIAVLAERTLRVHCEPYRALCGADKGKASFVTALKNLQTARQTAKEAAAERAEEAAEAQRQKEARERQEQYRNTHNAMCNKYGYPEHKIPKHS